MDNDGYQFKWLALDAADVVELMPEEYTLKQIHQFYYHNLSLAEWWKNVSSRFQSNFDRIDDPIPDISLWVGYASLVLNQKAFNALGDMLSYFGEFLPITCDSDTFYIFNCLTLIEADKAHNESGLRDGHSIGITKIGFNKKDSEEKLIFKTKCNISSDLFCGDEFKNAVESQALTGITFSTDLVPGFN
jgi:hypothetical protein